MRGSHDKMACSSGKNMLNPGGGTGICQPFLIESILAFRSTTVYQDQLEAKKTLKESIFPLKNF